MLVGNLELNPLTRPLWKWFELYLSREIYHFKKADKYNHDCNGAKRRCLPKTGGGGELPYKNDGGARHTF